MDGYLGILPVTRVVGQAVPDECCQAQPDLRLLVCPVRANRGIGILPVRQRNSAR